MKRKLFLAVLIIVFALMAASCTGKVEDVRIENKKLDDLNYFCENLEKNHKNLYANISKEEFLKERKYISERLEEMSDWEYYYSLKKLTSKIGDAHTNVYYSDSKYEHLSGLPFAIVKFGGDWRVFMLEKDKKEYLGDKLISINDVPIEDIFEKSKTIMSFENDVWAEMQFSNTINFQEALEYLGIVSLGEEVVLNVEKDDKTICNIPVKAMNAEEIMNADIIQYDRDKLPKTFPSGIYRAFELDDKNFFIQYNSCEESPDLSMKNFIEIIEGSLKEKDYDNLIIDMRYNSGGNSAIFEPMMHMIKDLKTQKDLKVYTLIGKNTFSSAIINSIETKELLDSTLVGTATGGNVNGYGEIKSFELNNSPIFVYYSTKYFELIKGYEKDSLYPDVEIEYSFDDYKKGIDKEVEFIRGN